MCTVEDVMAIAESVGADLTDCDLQTDLFEEGIVDSLQIALMVLEIEKKYGFRFSISDINPSVFLNIESIASFVNQKTCC